MFWTILSAIYLISVVLGSIILYHDYFISKQEWFIPRKGYAPKPLLETIKLVLIYLIFSPILISISIQENS